MCCCGLCCWLLGSWRSVVGSLAAFVGGCWLLGVLVAGAGCRALRSSLAVAGCFTLRVLSILHSLRIGFQRKRLLSSTFEAGYFIR